ncbi:MAG: hypothetical protein PWP31_634 [Clostridia bacterium]|nr:hypothetical protein [Clostridia bacterium]
MNSVKVPYGKGFQVAEIPDGLRLYRIEPKDVDGVSDPTSEIIRALENPIGNKGIEELRGMRKIVIVVSDLTRPVPNEIILKVLLEKLKGIDIEESQITVLIGAGLHQPVPKEDYPRVVGSEIIKRVKVISHDAHALDMLHQVGSSSLGTPIWVNKNYLEADGRILVGMIDPHQFAGFSGGAKGLSVGCCGEATIRANHAHLLDPEARLGRIEGNPAREDIDEIGGIVGINLIINVVLNNHKKIVKAFAGHYLKAHRAGVQLSRQLAEVRVRKKADIAIVSSGGYPKDLNLYQAQKGLRNATLTIKEGGIIILCVECKKGAGDKRFVKGMEAGNNPQEVVEAFKSHGFKMGFHKAFLWCHSLLHARVFLVSSGINEELAKILHVKKMSDLQTAINSALNELPQAKVISFLPKANSVIPIN